MVRHGDPIGARIDFETMVHDAEPALAGETEGAFPPEYFLATPIFLGALWNTSFLSRLLIQTSEELPCLRLVLSPILPALTPKMSR
jgi:hypothetical protein